MRAACTFSPHSPSARPIRQSRPGSSCARTSTTVAVVEASSTRVTLGGGAVKPWPRTARARRSSRSSTSRRPSSIRRRSEETSTESGGSPYSGTTLNTVTAVSPTAVALAPRTVSRCEASTPAARQSRPGRSSATTVTSLPSTIAAGPPSATSASWSSRSAAGSGIGSPSSTALTRRTRSATSPAFQSFQAAGPVASPSAMASARSSSSSVLLPPTVVATCSTVIGSSRSRRVATTGRRRGWRTASATSSTSVSLSPTRLHTSRATTSPETLWSPGQPLPMSCSSAASSSRSGRDTSRASAAALAAHSTRCRSTVKRCSGLRWGRFLTRSQSGISVASRPSWSSASQTAIALAPAPSSASRALRASGGHGIDSGGHSASRARARGAIGSPTRAGPGGARSTRTRGGHPHPQRRVGPRPPRPGQDPLAFLLDHAVGERPPVRLASSHPDAERPAAARPVGLAEGVIDRVGDGPARPRQLAPQGVPVAQAERPPPLALLLDPQPVKPSPGDLVEHVAGIQDLLVGGPDLGPGGGRDPGGGDRLDGVHVPLPAARLLQIRLEQVGELAVEPGPLLVQPLELGQPGPGVGPPVLERALAEPRRQVRVARDVPGVQQPEGDLEIAPGHPPGLRHGPHGVIEPGARVPDRVPDPVGDPGDAVPAVVQHQHVEVAAGEQFLAAVAADRDQGHAGLGPQHAGQPANGFSCPSAAISRERSHHAHQVAPRNDQRAPASGHARGTGLSIDGGGGGVMPALSRF